MTTKNVEAPELAESQTLAHVTVNEAIARLDGAIMLVVEDRDLTAPPGSPGNGDLYIVATGGTGAWAGHDGELAIFFNGWFFWTVKEGFRLWIKDEDVLLLFDGTNYQTLFDLGTANQPSVALGGTPTVSNQSRTFRVPVAQTDFTAAALSEQLTLFSSPAGFVLESVKIKHGTGFGGGGATLATLSVGNAGTPAKYATAFDVFQAPGNQVFQVENKIGSEDHGAAANVIVELVSDVNVNLLTQGAADIWVTGRKVT